jgi:hypothetical protein
MGQLQRHAIYGVEVIKCKFFELLAVQRRMVWKDRECGARNVA